MQNIAGSVRPTPWAEACCPLYWNKIRISVRHGPARSDQHRLLASLRAQEPVAPQSTARSDDGASSPRHPNPRRLHRLRLSVSCGTVNWRSTPMTFRGAELLPAAVLQRNCQSQPCWWLCCGRWTGGGTTHTSRHLCTCMTLFFIDNFHVFPCVNEGFVCVIEFGSTAIDPIWRLLLFLVQ